MRAKVRKNMAPGLWLGALIPILLFQSKQRDLGLEILLTAPVLFIFEQNHVLMKSIMSVAYGLQFVIQVLDSSRSLHTTFVIGFIFAFTISLLRMFPYSFSLGEAVLLTHLLAVFLMNYPLLLTVFLCCYFVERYSFAFSYRLLFYLFVCVLCAMGVFYTICTEHFYPSHLVMHKLMCFVNPSNVMLIVLWISLVLTCVLFTVHQKHNISVTKMPVPLEAQDNAPLQDIQQSTLSNGCTNGDSQLMATDEFTDMAPFWMRKVFHFAAGAVFTSGIITSPELLSVASCVVLLVLLLLEWARRRGPPTISLYLSEVVKPFRDSRDSGEIVFTPIALLLGLGIPLWWPAFDSDAHQIDISRLCDPGKPMPFVWSGVLSVAIGDSFAALVGRKWGKHRWPGSHRTIEGSLASWLTQLGAWCLLAKWYHWPLYVGLLPLTVGVLAEAYTDQIDNLVIPVIVMIFFPSKF